MPSVAEASAEPSAVKIAAHDLGLPVIETTRMTSDSIEKIIACALL